MRSCDAVDKNACLANARLIVIKIGSAVLADASGLNYAMLDALAAQMALVRGALPGRKLILVSSGAVAAGRGILASHDIPQPQPTQTAKQALAAVGQGSLMRAWNDAFAKHDIITAQALLTRHDFHYRDRFQHVADTFAEMLAWNVLPIVNENDTVAVHELKFGDNDTLGSLLVNLVEADLFINLTSAAGVKAENPEINPDAPIMASIENIAALNIGKLCGAKTSLGSGGMYSKLLAARRLAQLGVPTYILPGRVKDSLLKGFFPQDYNAAAPVGTWICAEERAIPRRKFWLAYQSDPEGSLIIDDGAAKALLEQGSSLLPGGIVAVNGEFASGALVGIIHDNEIVGVGFCNYDSAQLREIRGRKRHEIAAILGNPKYPDAVHRDNLLLDAAVAEEKL